MPEETVPFDRNAFPPITQRIRDFLAELSYIDKALEYIRQRDERFTANTSSGGIDEFHIELGTLYPFTRTLKLHDDFRNEYTVRDDLAALAGEANVWATSNMETFNYYASWITHPRVTLYNHIIKKLHNVQTKLTESIDPDIGDLTNNLSDWKGRAAEDFADHFYNPLKLVIANQAALADEITEAFITSQRIARLSQHSIMNAVTYTEKSVREQLLKRKEDNTGPSEKQILILAARAVDLMSAMGGPLGMSLETAADVLGFAEYHIPERVAETYTIEGASAEDLCAKLFDAVQCISRNARDGYATLEGDLRDLNARMDEHRRAGRLTAARPVLADGITDGQEFHHAHSGGHGS